MDNQSRSPMSRLTRRQLVVIIVVIVLTIVLLYFVLSGGTIDENIERIIRTLLRRAR